MRTSLVVAGVVALSGCSPTTSRVSGETPKGIPPTVQCKTASDGGNIVQTISWGADSLVGTAPAATNMDPPTSIAITASRQLYLTIEVTVDRESQRRTAVARFGKAFTGVRELVLDTLDGDTFSGTLDGRKLKPFTTGAWPEAFADGSALPAIAVDKGAQQEVGAFLEAVRAKPDACKGKEASAGPPRLADAIAGHQYNPDTGAACLFCLGDCIAITSWGVAAAVQACAGAGYAYPICLTAGILTAFIAGRICRDLCLSSRPGLCCPTDCHADGFCCDTGDSCLSTANHGLCCPADHPQTCGGVSCCRATDVCNAASGECCPAGQASCGGCGAIGQACCDGTRCLAGAGCSSGTCVACPTTSPIRTVGSAPREFAGNNCVGTDFTRVYGTRCDAGFQRDQCLATVLSSNDSRAFCRATWDDERDPTNCKCRVHFQAPSDCNGGIACSVQVTESQAGAQALPQGCPRP